MENNELCDRRIATYLFIFLSSLYLLTSSLRIDTGDGKTMYKVAYNLVANNTVSIPVEPQTTDFIGPWGILVPVDEFNGGDSHGSWGRDGKYYAVTGLGWSLAAVPFIQFGRWAGVLLPHLSEDFITKIFVMFLNPLLTAGASVLLYYLVRKYYSVSVALGIAIIYGTCTIAWYYAKSAFSEPLVVFLLLCAIWFIENRNFWWAGIVLGLILVTRQTGLFLLFAVFFWLIFVEYIRKHSIRFQNIIKILVPVMVGQLVVWFYNYVRFGSIFETGYARLAWDTPLLFGIYSQLISPGKGLLIYSPILILGMIAWIYPGKWRVLSVLIFVSFLIPHALYRHWSGGGGWGPRLLLPIVPILLLSAVGSINKMYIHRYGRLLLLVLVTYSLFIQFMGVSVNWVRHLQRVYDESTNSIEYFYRVHYKWSDSPIIGQIRSINEVSSIMIGSNSREELKGLLDPLSERHSGEWSSSAQDILVPNVLDFWYVYFWYFGLQPILLIIPVSLLLSIMLFFGIRLRTVAAINRSIT